MHTHRMHVHGATIHEVIDACFVGTCTRTHLAPSTTARVCDSCSTGRDSLPTERDAGTIDLHRSLLEGENA